MRIAAQDPWGRPVDLPLILDAGQTFRWWDRGRGELEGWAGAWPVRLVQDPSLGAGALEADPGEPAAAVAALARLVDLDRPYGQLDYALIRDEPRLEPAVRATAGLRIVRLDPWEALLSFLLSSHNNIARIKRMLSALAQALGRPPGMLPTAERLAAAGEQRLRHLGLGYRAAHVHATSRRLAGESRFLEEAAALTTPELVAELTGLSGVGPKVGECVALFGYGRWDAFPIDRWVKRALERTFFDGREMPLRWLQGYVRDRFGPHAALAQAHLFASERMRARSLKG